MASKDFVVVQASHAAEPPPAGASALSWHGTVESCYGPPWSHADRLAHLEFSGQVGFNTYVHAPKDDPYQRARWREPYPAAELAQLGELADTARALGIRFVVTISPGLSMQFTGNADHEALIGKADQLLAAGVSSFGLLFDDVPPELSTPADVVRFGQGRGGLGRAHGETCRLFAENFLVRQGIEDPLFFCPTDYAGTDPSAYRDQLAQAAPPDILIAWTGTDVVVGSVSRHDIDRAAASYRRRLILWDNFPVNDFDPARLFLGPLTGRTSDVAGSALHGVLANPMQRAAPSRFALATVADWVRDPLGYDPAVSAGEALVSVAGAGAAALAPLVRVCSSWPPSADQDPELTTATSGALDDLPGATNIVIRRLEELAAGCRAATEPEPLISALRPWLDGAIATAEAGVAAAGLLRAAREDWGEGQVASLRQRTRRALDAAEDHYSNVLRSIVPPFVREVLDRTAPPEVSAADGRPVVVVVTGSRPTAGDRAVIELLEARGFVARSTDRPDQAGTKDAALVVVAGSAEPEAMAAVAGVPVPLLTWRGVVDLGLARRRNTQMIRGPIRIMDPDDPLAAGRRGAVSILREAAWMTIADVDDTHAHVVARADDGDGAAIFRYAAGDPLPDGTTAPATRVGLFLGPDGPARWLLTEDGNALVAAALETATVTAG